MKTTEIKTHKYFHVFTDNKDEYIPAADGFKVARKAAFDKAKEWILFGDENIRIYEVIEEEENGEFEQIEENCIYSLGEYPA